VTLRNGDKPNIVLSCPVVEQVTCAPLSQLVLLSQPRDLILRLGFHTLAWCKKQQHYNENCVDEVQETAASIQLVGDFRKCRISSSR